jgi:hypothetical protein
MSRSRAAVSASTPRRSTGAASFGSLAIAAAAGIAVAAAVVVFHRALTGYFAQDDFAGLARAAGLLPRLSGAWRFISGQVYFDLMRGAAGLDPAPYHLASLAAHAACAALLALLLARRFSAPAAALAATAFATHPALFTALYSISGIGEILALLFALLATLAITSRGAVRWLALPAFALSLLSKESTLLLPVALAFGFAAPARPADRAGTGSRLRDPVLLALAVSAAAYLAYFLFGDVFSARSLPVDAAYAIDFGSAVPNALTYLGWTANFCILTVRGFTDAVDPPVFSWGAALAALWVGGAFARGLRERGWLLGGLAFALLLAPVLPLRNHTYHYYLYAPLAAAAWCLAAAFDALVSRLRLPAACAVAGVAIAALALNGWALVRKVETQPFIEPEMRADPTVDRARIARNAIEDLRAAGLRSRTRVWFWSPSLASGADPRAGYWESNLRSALMDGLAARVMLPQVVDVRFVRAFEPAPSTDRYAIYTRDGRLRVVEPATLDSLLRAHPLE